MGLPSSPYAMMCPRVYLPRVGCTIYGVYYPRGLPSRVPLDSPSPSQSPYPRVTPSTCPNLGSTTSRGVYFHTPPDSGLFPLPASLCPRQKDEEEKRGEWKRY